MIFAARVAAGKLKDDDAAELVRWSARVATALGSRSTSSSTAATRAAAVAGGSARRAEPMPRFVLYSEGTQ